MFIKHKAVIAAAALGFAAMPAAAQAPAGSTYIMKAGASDLYEKTSSEIVLQSTQDPKVREFAQGMIRDHSKSTADIKAAAAQGKLKVPPPKLNAEQARMVAQLRAAKGVQRDALYWDQQKVAHQQALALHQSYAEGGKTPSLKAVAANVVPVVQHHIEMLNGNANHSM